MNIKCKHCRKYLFDGEIVQLLTAHSGKKKHQTDRSCGDDDLEPCLYLSGDEMPQYIQQLVNQENWTKGRIHCTHCNNRVGSFNFVNEMKCKCGKHITPPIRIIHSKVDVLYNNQ